MGIKCSSPKIDGTPCGAWAVPGTNPPLCSAHGGTGTKGGAPRGNQNARKHGGYALRPDSGQAQPVGPSTSLDRELEILTQRIEDVESFIHAKRDELTHDEYIRVNALLGALCSRKGRLLLNRRALSGEDADDLSRMFEEAARMIKREKGWHD